MRIAFPSREFDDAVAGVCHGVASEEQMEGLRESLRGDARARDEYLHRVALHAHLASEPDLFAEVGLADGVQAGTGRSLLDPASEAGAGTWSRPAPAGWTWKLALAAGIMVALGWVGWLGLVRGSHRKAETSRAVAMLNRVVNARWNRLDPVLRLGAPLEPGRLRLESGLAQIVFYNGARVAIEGPAELRLVSSTEAVCVGGTLTAEVPPQARGFRIGTPRLEITDLGTVFGLKVRDDRSELHVFEGRVEFRARKGVVARNLAEGRGAVLEGDDAPKWIAADPTEFGNLFGLQAKSVAAEARRHDQWRESVRKLRLDPSLWVHFDFEHGGAPDWRLPNAGSRSDDVPEGTIVGCEWREGRWTTKPALEFRGISDRVRLTVPGELESMTLAAWVRVQGLDRQINSLFMSEGFLPGTLHWVIRHDGVLGLTVIGGKGQHQILASPPVMTIDQFGIWTHLAVVLDGAAREVVHYLNGRQISRHALRVPPPFHFGAAELGNWNAHGFPGDDPFLIRNFSGAVDEFCLFDRALTSGEIETLHGEGRPQPESSAASYPVSRGTDEPSTITSIHLEP